MKVVGNIVDIRSRNIFSGEIVVKNGVIEKIVKNGDEDDAEKYILPGLVNAHMHVESTMLSPAEYARAAVRFGSVASVCDPHEIANVLGVYGIDYMIQNGKTVPYKFYFGAPSCVPATDFETAGFRINAETIKSLLKNDDIYFLGEMMNYPGIVNEDPETVEKVKAGLFYGKPVDGHAPGLSGNDLKKYIASGITTDHECVNIEEAIEKIELGMKIQIREGSAAKNFDALYKLIEMYPDKIMLCTDDSHPDDLLNGHMDEIVRQGISKNIGIFDLLRTVTVNPVEHYNLGVGMLQKDDNADFIIINNLRDFKVEKTVINGAVVYENDTVSLPESKMVLINNFARKNIRISDIASPVENYMPVIGVIDGELITKKLDDKIKVRDGHYISDVHSDVLKLVVFSRYDNNKPSIGFVKNFGLQSGAIASSIAHDSHNIIAVGVSDEMIVKALNEVVNAKGGVAASDAKGTELLPLEIAGLMTNDRLENVAEAYKTVDKKAKEMGCTLHAPFMTLSFLSLLVIPELKLSDKGLFDVNNFEFIN